MSAPKSAGGSSRFPVAQTNPPMAGGFGAVVALSPDGADGSDFEEPVGATTGAARPSTELPLAAATRGQGGRACAAGNLGPEGPDPTLRLVVASALGAAFGRLWGAKTQPERLPVTPMKRWGRFFAAGRLGSERRPPTFGATSTTKSDLAARSTVVPSAVVSGPRQRRDNAELAP